MGRTPRIAGNGCGLRPLRLRPAALAHLDRGPLHRPVRRAGLTRVRCRCVRPVTTRFLGGVLRIIAFVTRTSMISQPPASTPNRQCSRWTAWSGGHPRRLATAASRSRSTRHPCRLGIGPAGTHALPEPKLLEVDLGTWYADPPQLIDKRDPHSNGPADEGRVLVAGSFQPKRCCVEVTLPCAQV